MSLVDSYYAETLKQAEIDGEIADLVKLMRRQKQRSAHGSASGMTLGIFKERT